MSTKPAVPDDADSAGPKQKIVGYRMDSADAKRLKGHANDEDETVESALNTLALAWVEGLVDLHGLRAKLQKLEDERAGSQRKS